MKFVFDFLSEQSVVAVITLVVGALLKRKVKSGETVASWAQTNVIPWVTLLLTFAGYTLMPTSAEAAGFLSPALPALGAGTMAIMQTVLVTGAHSAYKNALKPLLAWTLYRMAQAIIEKQLPKPPKED